MRYVAAFLMAWPLLVSAPVRAEQPLPPDRPIVVPPSAATMTEVERQLEEFMAKRRLEMKPLPTQSPSLGYDLRTAIQQRMIEKTLPR